MQTVAQAFADAVALHQAGQEQQAELAYRQLLTQYGLHAPTLCNLGVLLAKQNKLDEAQQQYELALATIPNYADAHFNLGNIFRRRHQHIEAISQYQLCIQSNNAHTSAVYNLGLCFSATGDLLRACECFRIVAQREPKNADAYSHYGDTLARLGRLPEAIAAFETATRLAPADPRHLYNLGLAYANADRHAEANDTLQKTLKLNPGYAEAENALGLNLEAQGRKDDAMFHYQKAIELKPDLADAWSNLGTNLAEQGRCEEAIRCLRESLELRPHAPQIHSNLLLLLNYSSAIQPDEVAHEHSEWARLHVQPTPDPVIPAAPHDSQRRLRWGYLSSDFRKHTVSSLIEVLFTNHDREQVELFAYANVTRTDEVTEKLKQHCDHWRYINGQPDSQVFEQMQKDQLDVLIDLNGHTAGNRLTLMAARPAPVTATLFGYPNTTGLQAVDFRITDELSDPVGLTESFYTEALLRLPHTAWVYSPPSDVMIEPALLPAASQRMLTFGCLNNPAKISEACLQSWVHLLQTVPGTRLVLLGGQSQAGTKKLMDRITKAGILRDRVEILTRLPREKYFQMYQQIDIALDPFPYNGGVTTGDALWMGVPVLTVAGSSYVSRQGLMMNHTVGLNEFTLASPDELPATAKFWKQNLPELAKIRQTLRQRLLDSPLANASMYVRDLEAALRRAWIARLPAV